MSERHIGYFIKNITDRIRGKADMDLKSHGLTLAQSRVLGFLHECGNEATQKEIEDYLEVSHPTVVGIVTRMEQNGFVTCYPDPENGRNKMVKMTPYAKQSAESMHDVIQAQENQMLSGFSEQEISCLENMLERIYRNIQ